MGNFKTRISETAEQYRKGAEACADARVTSETLWLRIQTIIGVIHEISGTRPGDGNSSEQSDPVNDFLTAYHKAKEATPAAEVVKALGDHDDSPGFRAAVRDADLAETLFPDLNPDEITERLSKAFGLLNEASVLFEETRVIVSGKGLQASASGARQRSVTASLNEFNQSL